MFPLLEYYMMRSDESIESEYNDLMEKIWDNKKDFDPLMIVILHDFITNSSNFNTMEVKMFSNLIRLRKAKAIITFKTYFKTMKDEVLNFSIPNREADLEVIRSAMNVPVKENVEIIDLNPYPEPYHQKNEYFCDIGSPQNGERHSQSDEYFEIPVHYATSSNSVSFDMRTMDELRI